MSKAGREWIEEIASELMHCPNFELRLPKGKKSLGQAYVTGLRVRDLAASALSPQKVSSKKVAGLAAKIVELDPQHVSFNFIRQQIHLTNNGRVVTLTMSEFVGLCASVLSQAQPKQKPKKARART